MDFAEQYDRENLAREALFEDRITDIRRAFQDIRDNGGDEWLIHELETMTDILGFAMIAQPRLEKIEQHIERAQRLLEE